MTPAKTLGKVGMVAGVILGVASQLQALPLPPKGTAILGSIATIAGMLAALFHPSPTAPTQA